MKAKYETLDAVQFVFSQSGRRLITAALVQYQSTLEKDLSDYKRIEELLNNVFDIWRERLVPKSEYEDLPS